MIYRKLGRTNLEVSEIGIGTWGMGGNLWLDSDDKESTRSLQTAIELGVNFIDTALAYGNGHSEELIGRVLRERKEKIYIATKIPPHNRKWPAQKEDRFREAFPRDHIIASTESSLRNLKVDCIDLQQFHVWNDEWANEREWQDTLMELKSQGKIRFAGISMNSHEPENGIKAAGTGLIDVFQVFYNIFDQSPEKVLFGFCRRNEIGIIARVPFDEGSLTGNLRMDTEFPEGDYRNGYFAKEKRKRLIDLVERLREYLGVEAATLPELALRYVLNESVVSTVIPGMRKVSHVESDCSVADGRKLSSKLIDELKQFHYYG
ncbi:MAG TPA: aldo/keto reductase [Candidatus Kryptonia bacterium]